MLPEGARPIGHLLRELRDALLAAFPTRAALQQLLRYGMDKNLDAIAGSGNLSDVIFELLEATQASGGLSALVDAAIRWNPGNEQLRAFVLSWDGSSPEAREAATSSPRGQWRPPEGPTRGVAGSMDTAGGAETPAEPSASCPARLEEVRESYRAVYEFQRQLFGALSELSDALEAAGLDFVKWEPTSGFPAKPVSPFFRMANSLRTFLPCYGLSIVWERSNGKATIRKRVKVEVITDSGAPATMTGDPALDRFAPLEQARSWVKIHVLRTNMDNVELAWRQYGPQVTLCRSVPPDSRTSYCVIDVNMDRFLERSGLERVISDVEARLGDSPGVNHATG